MIAPIHLCVSVSMLVDQYAQCHGPEYNAANINDIRYIFFEKSKWWGQIQNLFHKVK